MKAKCIYCGEYKEVYATKESEWENHLKPYRESIVTEKKGAFKEGDVIHWACCKECYESGQVA